MTTPAQELGYYVGQRFIVIEGDGPFRKGSIVELYHDDGSDHPLFKLIHGHCVYNNAYGSPGAYLDLSSIQPVSQGLQMKYFVLKPKGNDIYAQASREALLHYAKVVAEVDNKLATALLTWVRKEEAK